MKKVTIRCISNYSLMSKYHITIFDKYNNIVFENYIKNGIIELYLKKGVYRMNIIPFNIYLSMLRTCFIVMNENNNFIFDISKADNSLKITVLLVDKNYLNLPIERGKIKLWQDHTQ